MCKFQFQGPFESRDKIQPSATPLEHQQPRRDFWEPGCANSRPRDRFPPSQPKFHPPAAPFGRSGGIFGILDVQIPVPGIDSLPPNPNSILRLLPLGDQEGFLGSWMCKFPSQGSIPSLPTQIPSSGCSLWEIRRDFWDPGCANSRPRDRFPPSQPKFHPPAAPFGRSGGIFGILDVQIPVPGIDSLPPNPNSILRLLPLGDQEGFLGSWMCKFPSQGSIPSLPTQIPSSGCSLWEIRRDFWDPGCANSRPRDRFPPSQPKFHPPAAPLEPEQPRRDFWGAVPGSPFPSRGSLGLSHRPGLVFRVTLSRSRPFSRSFGSRTMQDPPRGCHVCLVGALAVRSELCV
ncbi:uncharacterized protein LOC115948773 [Geospiza fortis]|uniref:Uncharacterized protein LOC115948773 n=1 Tax=Geospiza fortis TaxID=48883 RepID=A0A8N5EWV3_GEOFO|nr:uncharacterized protein LOC115948773 [Geospiza fortis]